ncbi:MAG: hypothetical protein ACLFQE_00025 [Thermotogota bacterium]
MSDPHIAESITFEELPGYVYFNGIKTITSPVFAAIPSETMRDQTQLQLLKVEDKVWAENSDHLYSLAEEIKPFDDDAITLIIGKDGLNEWVKTQKVAVLTFQIPET